MTRKENVARFVEVYGPELVAAVTNYPDEYAFAPSEALKVAARMAVGFESGSYNHAGRAIRATAKKLGLKKATRGALELYFREGRV
jgi:hypothetical protein